MVSEAIIRDHLALNLELLEPGLCLLEKEHLLRNSLGTKGFVDILAKDCYGNRVIIELKRSNHSAREAIHELCKYVALFQIQHKIPPIKIRCFVVSTEWHELLLPFAEFVSNSQFQVEGFHLFVDDSGHITSVSNITVPNITTPTILFEEHCILFYTKLLDRSNIVTTICSAIELVGAESYILALLDYNGQNTNIIYPYAIYVVPVNIKKNIWYAIEQEIRENLELANDQAIDEEIRQYMQDEFLFYFVEKIDGAYDCIEIGYPEKFTNCILLGWYCTKIIRGGCLSSKYGATDDEIIRMVQGLEGWHSAIYERTTKIKFILDWKDAKTKATYPLGFNNVWKEGYNWFADYVEREFKNASIIIKIYNPENLLITLYNLVFKNNDYTPNMELLAIDPEEQRIMIVHGIIRWDGKTQPESFNAIMKFMFKDPNDLLLHLHFGSICEKDEELMKQHGFEYALLREDISNSSKGLCSMMELCENGLKEYSIDDFSIPTLSDFMEKNKDYLKELVNTIDSLRTPLKSEDVRL